MKHKLILCLACCLLLTRTAHAQWIVTDPVNLAGNIANTIKEIATASKTVNNTLRVCQTQERSLPSTHTPSVLRIYL